MSSWPEPTVEAVHSSSRTDDLNAIDYMVGQYTPWFDWDVHPVIDVAESAEHGAEANAWAKQATG